MGKMSATLLAGILIGIAFIGITGDAYVHGGATWISYAASTPLVLAVSGLTLRAVWNALAALYRKLFTK